MEVDALFLIINKNSNAINEKQRTANNALPRFNSLTIMETTAQFGLLFLLSLFLVLHFMILLKTIPYHLVWGGRIKSDKEMYRFEIFSIIINSLFVIVVLLQAGLLIIGMPKKLINYALWLMTALFLLNTFGNAVSKNKLEQKLFTPITILLTVFSLILALSN